MFRKKKRREGTRSYDRGWDDGDLLGSSPPSLELAFLPCSMLSFSFQYGGGVRTLIQAAGGPPVQFAGAQHEDWKLQGSRVQKPGKFFSLRSRLEAGSAPITVGRPPRTPRRGGSVASQLPASEMDGWLNLTASLALRTDTSAQIITIPSSNSSLFAPQGSHAPSKLGY